MNNVLQCAISDIIITICNLYIWLKLFNKTVNFKSKKTYIIIALMYIVTLINYLYINQFIRIIVITMFMAVFIKIMFNEKFNKSILASLTAQMIYMISEILFIFIISTCFNLNANDIANTQFGTVSANFIISCISAIIATLPLTHRFYEFLYRITSKIRNIHLIVFIFIVIMFANILAITAYYKIGFSYLLLFNTFLTLFCLCIVLYSFKTKNNYIKVYDKYNTTLTSLKEYEEILDKYRVSNHENKNQLLTIRNMLPKNNKKVINYIDTIVENKLKDNDKVMYETSKIPAGGLRGLIYSKLLLMNNLGIQYDMEISSNVRTVDLINNIDDSTMLDMCKIIGVYLDNAIQAVENIDKKYVDIEMYLDEKYLLISISNNYKGFLNIEKIEEKGYTSKGSGHGYGLSLTKEIIDNNKLLSNEKKISKETFTQILKIKM